MYNVELDRPDIKMAYTDLQDHKRCNLFLILSRIDFFILVEDKAWLCSWVIINLISEIYQSELMTPQFFI